MKDWIRGALIGAIVVVSGLIVLTLFQWSKGCP